MEKATSWFWQEESSYQFQGDKTLQCKADCTIIQTFIRPISSTGKNSCLSICQKVKIDEEGEEVYDSVVPGDIETSKSLGELQKTLKALRYKFNYIYRRAGHKYIVFGIGLLKWTESDDSDYCINLPTYSCSCKVDNWVTYLSLCFIPTWRWDSC